MATSMSMHVAVHVHAPVHGCMRIYRMRSSSQAQVTRLESRCSSSQAQATRLESRCMHKWPPTTHSRERASAHRARRRPASLRMGARSARAATASMCGCFHDRSTPIAQGPEARADMGLRWRGVGAWWCVVVRGSAWWCVVAREWRGGGAGVARGWRSGSTGSAGVRGK